MNKFELLQAHEQGRLTAKQVMHRLGISDKGLVTMLRAYRPHLDWLVPMLARLDTPTKPAQTAIKRAIGERLGVSYNQVNRLLRQGKVDVPKPKIVEIRAEKHKKFAKRRETTQKVIKSLAKGRISQETAQNLLKITDRQVARHLSRLVTPIGYSVPDFKRLPRAERTRLVAQRA